MWALAPDDSVIPRVVFLLVQAPIKEALEFARPGFRLWISCGAISSQADFWPCPLRWIPDPPESTLGRPRYLLEGVPPQPNYLPTGVPTITMLVSCLDLEGWCSICASTIPSEIASMATNYALHQSPSNNDRLQ